MTEAISALQALAQGQVEADGYQIRYWEGGRGDPVVALEGVSWGLTRLHEALAEQYRLVVLELPGFGASPANAGSGSVADLANTAAQALARLGLERFSLVGTSFSAHVALWQTLQAPAPVEALVLISPTALRPTGDPLGGPPEQWAGQLLAHPEALSQPIAIDPAVFEKERALVQRLQGTTHDGVAESRLGEVQCPTLVAFGSKDRLVSPEAARIYREKIPNCNVSLVYDAGHLILAERPEALVNVVSDYITNRETFIVGRQSSVINP